MFFSKAIIFLIFFAKNIKLISSKVCIIGAGPGGATAALFLAKMGIECILVDKAKFPRDKICGDALSGKVVESLNKIISDFTHEFSTEKFQLPCHGVEFVAPNLQSIKLPFKKDFETQKIAPGFISRRIDFDNYLINEVKKYSQIKLFEETNISFIEKQNDGWLLKNEDETFVCKTNLVIAANGAHSQFSKKIGGIELEHQHYCAGLRAYYKNVDGLDKFNFIELHFLKEFLPGYFWIFPLPNGAANVGVGMRSDFVSKKKINLKNEMLQIIATNPILKERFKNAELMDDIKGYCLPLGSKKRKLSGDGFMLIGDAASLIDPFTGEGVGNAMWSAELAALQVKNCIEKNNFSANELSNYDKAVYKKLGDELQLSYRMQQLVNFPWLFNFIVRKANSNKLIRDTLMCMFDDVSIREQLKKPSFYFRLLFKGN